MVERDADVVSSFLEARGGTIVLEVVQFFFERVFCFARKVIL